MDSVYRRIIGTLCVINVVLTILLICVVNAKHKDQPVTEESVFVEKQAALGGMMDVCLDDKGVGTHLVDDLRV